MKNKIQIEKLEKEIDEDKKNNEKDTKFLLFTIILFTVAGGYFWGIGGAILMFIASIILSFFLLGQRDEEIEEKEFKINLLKSLDELNNFNERT